MPTLHPCINPDLIDYLEISGYRKTHTRKFTAEFRRGSFQVTFSHTKAIVERYLGGEAPAQILEIDLAKTDLDVFAWAQILDAIKAVSLRQTIQALPREERDHLLDQIKATLAISPAEKVGP